MRPSDKKFPTTKSQPLLLSLSVNRTRPLAIPCPSIFSSNSRVATWVGAPVFNFRTCFPEFHGLCVGEKKACVTIRMGYPDVHFRPLAKRGQSWRAKASLGWQPPSSFPWKFHADVPLPRVPRKELGGRNLSFLNMPAFG